MTPPDDFEKQSFELPDPDATAVVPPSSGSGGDDTPGDLRIIPVEVETTFVFDADGEATAPLPTFEDLAPPEAVLLDAGDLAGVEEVLIGLGVDTARIESAHPHEDLTWPTPTRLLVASGHLAMGLRIRDAHDMGYASLAVSDEESRGFARRMREQGFQYVVNQPIHPDVLRLLLQQTLFRGPHQRRALRYPVEQQVTWRRGRRRRQATLVELSSLGGRLHVGHPAALEAPVTLRVLSRRSGSPLQLRGRVVRCDRRPGSGQRFALGVAWDLPTETERQDLDDLLASPARQLPEAAIPQPASRPGRGMPPRTPATRPPRRPSDLRLPDRRNARRAELTQEIVALDTENRVCTTLVGRDISPRAVRVENDDQLVAGQHLRIAVHTARGEEPLVVESLVIRDDGTRGAVLGFVDLAPADETRVERIVNQLPAVSAERSRNAA